MSTEKTERDTGKKAGWKPWFYLLGIPLLLEITEFVMDAWKGDGNGVIDRIDTPLTVYQLISFLIFLLWLAKFFSDKGRRGFSRFVFFIAGFFFLLLIAEGVARVIYALSDRGMQTVEGFRLSRPAPYADAPYFSEEFVRESTEKLEWKIPPGTNLIQPVDFEGKYIHVRNGLRVTTDVPENASQRVFVFGGSTIFCNEVPDSFTVCSYLQRALEAKWPGRFEVVNYGVTSVNAAQECGRLKTVQTDSNDIVIFYDGVNDIFNTLYYDNPNGTILSAQLEAYNESGLSRFFYDMYERFTGNSKLIALLFNPYAVEAPAHLSDAVHVNELRTELFDNYTGYIAAARVHCYDQGSRFVHFLQPDLYSEKKLSTYEQEMFGYFEYPGARNVFRIGRPVLQKAIDQLNGKNSRSTDLSAIFEQEKAEVYLDFCHVAHRGNEIIANHMVNTLIEKEVIK